MSINYNELLSNEQKYEIVSQRITQFASEAYQYSLNRKTAEEFGAENKDEQLEQIDKQISLLETAINIHKQELAELATA